MHPLPVRSPFKPRLLGSAATALAIMLTVAPAVAQTTTTQANGRQTLVNQQSAAAGTALATVDTGAATVATGPVDGSTIAVTDDAVGAAARSNQVALSLTPVADDDTPLSTSLTAGTAGVAATAGAAIANNQSSGGISRAGFSGAISSIGAGPVSDSQLDLSRNSQEAIALGNDASGTVAMSGTATNGGAGIASAQATTAASASFAIGGSRIALDTGAVTDSDLTNTDNLSRAIAEGNATDNAVSAKLAEITVPDNAGRAAVVPLAGATAPYVTAGFGLLSNQSASGVVKGRADDGTGSPVIQTAVNGDVTGSSIATDTNTLAAAAYANQSWNALDLAATSIADTAGGSDGAGPGAAASITDVQRAAGATVSATMTGGVATDVSGGLAGSSLSASGNDARTIAAANLATENLLTVSANTVDAVGGVPTRDRTGAALVDGIANAASDAGFGVQNVQDYADSAVTASQMGSVTAAIGRTIDGSTVKIDSNTALASGAGNSAVSAATFTATALHSSVALDNLQSGYGDVTASLGTDTARGGALLDAAGMMEGSSLSATSNSATGTAIGNGSTNSLNVTASTIANGSNEAGAAAGQVGTAQGASGTFALASDQTLGLRSFTAPVSPSISSSVSSETGVAGGSITNTTVSVDDNVQRANALGNTTVNRLAVTAATLDGAAGSALSSAQFGQANVSAASDAKLVVPQALSSSTASVSGNTNAALGVINDADNGLSVSAAGTTGPALSASLWSDGIELPVTTGGHLVVNRQLATGSATASATTTLAGDNVGDGLGASGFTVSGNTTSAEAAANRALNTASVDVGSGQASVGVANTQTSVAAVNASALTTLGDPIAQAGTAVMAGSSLKIDGNSTSALARGNAADNEIALGGGSSPGISNAAFNGFTNAQAPAASINTQTNYGEVIATAQQASFVPLNGSGSLDRSSLGSTGNSAAASAYGNAATNTVALSGLAGQGAAIGNIQTNHNAVVAQVTGASYRGVSGPLSATALSATGNQLEATAVGNQASSAIASTR